MEVTIEQLIDMHVKFDPRGFPRIASRSLQTPNGTYYLREPGVFMIARPDISLEGLSEFFKTFDPSLNFDRYLDDPTPLDPGSQLAKFAGQACYASFGPGRTKNDGARGYFDNILGSGHGSVVEHPYYSFFVHGISRSTTHEVVRHRAGWAYSQLSQRYVSGRVLRFIERPEYVDDPHLHARFAARVEFLESEYNETASYLQRQQELGESKLLSADARTDLRKKVQQTARSVLPNETETWLVMTANVRAWRHFIEMRASEHAEVEIRRLALYLFLCLRAADPIQFADYELKKLSDGTFAVNGLYRKV